MKREKKEPKAPPPDEGGAGQPQGWPPEPPLTIRNVEGDKIEIEESAAIYEGYRRIERILQERDMVLPKAILHNIMRRPPGVKDGILGAAAAAIVGLIAQDPFIGLAGAAVAGLFRNVRETWSLQRGGGANLPDVPEFKSLWLLSCYAFVRQVKGYNTRFELVRVLHEEHGALKTEKDRRRMHIAFRIEELLLEAKPQVFEEMKAMNRIRSSCPTENGELEERMRYADPLSLTTGRICPLDWLILDQDHVRLEDARKRLQEDVRRIAAIRATERMVDPDEFDDEEDLPDVDELEEEIVEQDRRDQARTRRRGDGTEENDD